MSLNKLYPQQGVEALNYINFSQEREERAKHLLQQKQPEMLNENTYLVPSQFDSTKKYKVTHLDSYSCECEDFKQRCVGSGMYCKHIKAILLFEKVKNAIALPSGVNEELGLIADAPVKEECPYCHSSSLIKRGVRKTSVEEKQRYSCKECKKRFVLTPLKNIKGNAKFVCLAMDCYYKGLSYRDISDQFKQFYGLSLHHETIRRWVLKFGEVMEKYSKTLTPKTGTVWNADETMIRTKKAEMDYEYVWNVMDNQTRFLLASVNSGKGRDVQDAKKVMVEAWKQNKQRPETIITDKLGSYSGGIRKGFRTWDSRGKIKHISIVGRRKQINNNAIENLHTHQKEFHKVRRGVNEVQGYADGFKVFHNFVRKAVKDQKTPAERAGIGVEGRRWETLLTKSLQVPKATEEYNLIKSS